MQIPLRPMQAIALQPPWAGENVWYSSLVLDFIEGKELSIGVPMSRGDEVIIPLETRVKLQIALPDGLRRFTAVIRRRNVVSPPSLVLSWPEDPQRIQRRDNVRVEVAYRAEARPVQEDGRLGSPISAYTSDISAGGARLRLPERVEPQSTIQLTISLPELGDRMCDARVLRVGEEPAGGSSGLRYWAAVEFSNIAEPVRREITKLVFDVQREQLRKGVV